MRISQLSIFIRIQMEMLHGVRFIMMAWNFIPMIVSLVLIYELNALHGSSFWVFRYLSKSTIDKSVIAMELNN